MAEIQAKPIKEETKEEQSYHPKYSHLRVHFQVKPVHLIRNSINETKEHIIRQLCKISSINPKNFNEYIFLDKELNYEYTLYIGFKYDNDAYHLYRKNAFLSLPSKDGVDRRTFQMEPTELFKFLIDENKLSYEKEYENWVNYNKSDDNIHQFYKQQQSNDYRSSSSSSPRRVFLFIRFINMITPTIMIQTILEEEGEVEALVTKIREICTTHMYQILLQRLKKLARNQKQI